MDTTLLLHADAPSLLLIGKSMTGNAKSCQQGKSEALEHQRRQIGRVWELSCSHLHWVSCALEPVLQQIIDHQVPTTMHLVVSSDANCLSPSLGSVHALRRVLDYGYKYVFCPAQATKDIIRIERLGKFGRRSVASEKKTTGRR
eukprot:5594640-Amphidinium_carterae.1